MNKSLNSYGYLIIVSIWYKKEKNKKEKLLIKMYKAINDFLNEPRTLKVSFFLSGLETTNLGHPVLLYHTGWFT